MITKTFRACKPRKTFYNQFRKGLANQLSGTESTQFAALNFDADEFPQGLPSFDSDGYCIAAGGPAAVVGKHPISMTQHDDFITAYNGTAKSITLTAAQITGILGPDSTHPVMDYIYFETEGNGPLTYRGGQGFEDVSRIDYSGCFLRGLIAAYPDETFEFTTAFDTVHGTDTLVIKAGNGAGYYDFSNEHP